MAKDIFKSNCCTASLKVFKQDSQQTKEVRTDDVIIFTIQMHDGENRFTPAMIRCLNEALDCIESLIEDYKKGFDRLFEGTIIINHDEGIEKTMKKGCLIVTGKDKVFSLGLDLQSLYDQKDAAEAFRHGYATLLARLTTFPLVSVALINGHAVAGGLLLSLACDYRVMRDGPGGGLVAMNEIHLPSSIPAGMVALLVARCGDPRVARDLMLLGRRVKSAEAKKMGIIDELVDPMELKAFERVTEFFAFDRSHDLLKGKFLRAIKQTHLRSAVSALLDVDPIDHFKLALGSHL